MSKQIIYLDNNATTQTLPEVAEAMLPYFTQKYGNASSIHSFGGGNKKAIEAARAQVAALINAEPNEIIFNSGGTEGDNTAILAALKNAPGKKHIITSAVEHPAVLEVFKDLQTQGYKVDFIGVDAGGALDVAALQKAVTQDTALVSIMWANSETGVILPVQEISKICRAQNVPLHIDGVQALGKIAVDVKGAGADMVSFSAHKIHGPKGVGALYVRRGFRLHPYLIGGHQERGRRAGTENVPGIVGFGCAAQIAQKTLHIYEQQVAPLRDVLEAGLLAAIPHAQVNGTPLSRLPNTTNISFGYIEGESILMFLDEHGICASSGSACTSGSLEPSHVLRAMGVGFQFAHGSVRFSLSKFNTRQEIDTVLEVLPGIVKRLREISPFSAQAAACSVEGN